MNSKIFNLAVELAAHIQRNVYIYKDHTGYITVTSRQSYYEENQHRWILYAIITPNFKELNNE